MFRPKTPTVPAAAATTVTWIDATASAYGLSTSGTAAANATALGLADSAAVAAGKRLWIPKGSYSTTGVTFSSFVMMETGAIFVASSGILAFNGGVEWDISPHLTLTGTATATFSKQKTIVGYAEWWGAVTNSVGTDCAPALNAAVVALRKTQLMPACYYCASVITHATAYNWLIGAHGEPTNAAYTVPTNNTLTSTICSTSATATILTITATDSLTSGFLCTRNIAPTIAGASIGVSVLNTHSGIVEKVGSQESMTGWKIGGTSNTHINNCISMRSAAGTGAGTDTFTAFWVDGTDTTGLNSGNASLYINKPHALVPPGAFNTSGATSIAYKVDKGFMDVFFDHPECETFTQSMVITGNGLTTADYGNQDFYVRHPVFEASKECVSISGTNNIGSIQFIGGYLYSSLDTAPTVLVSNSKCPITFTGVEYMAIGKTTQPVIKVSNSSGVESLGGHIVEAKGNPVLLDVADNCKFTDRCSNWVNAGKEVSITNSDRNQFAMGMYGSQVRAKGYNVTDALSGYNEFNCTGIDPACITGGAANKLVINGTQVTATGIAAAGHGTNVVSGVMA